MHEAFSDRSRRRTETVVFILVCAFYTVRTLATHSGTLIWDEARYLECAVNLSKGWLASDNNTDFVNGPGYPIVLWPFVTSGASLLWPRLINGVFIGLAALLLVRTLRPYAGDRWAAAISLLTAFHPNLVRLGPYIMTEPLTTFCVCAFAHTFAGALREPGCSWRRIAAASVSFAYLIMTRVIFGHVVLVMLAGALVAMPVFRRSRTALVRTALICACSFALCIPYLAYTRAHTGQTLCWSTNGGELLYWMTSHHPGENGHWFSYDDAITRPELAPNHKAFIERVNKLDVPAREAEFSKAAREHITSAPRAVAFNWVCNVCRLVFGFPRSFMPEEVAAVPVIVFNAPLLMLMTLAVVLFGRRPSSVPPEIVILLGMALVYLGGSSLVSGLPRYFFIITPLLWLFTAASLAGNLRVTLVTRTDAGDPKSETPRG